MSTHQPTTRRSPAWRQRSGPTGAFPVTPMLDMAFQLLAFFILTYQSPSNESRLDLDLPAQAAALPGTGRGAGGSAARSDDADQPSRPGDLEVRASADAEGRLATLRLAGAEVADMEALERRLARLARFRDGQPVRVRLVADDDLRFNDAARLMGVMTRAGVGTIRLAGPEPKRVGGTP